MTIMELLGFVFVFIVAITIVVVAIFYVHSLLKRVNKTIIAARNAWMGVEHKPPTHETLIIDPDLLEKIRGSNISMRRDNGKLLISIVDDLITEIYSVEQTPENSVVVSAPVAGVWTPVNPWQAFDRIKLLSKNFVDGPEVDGKPTPSPTTKRVKNNNKSAKKPVSVPEDKVGCHWKKRGPKGEIMRGPNGQTPPNASPMRWTDDYAFVPEWDNDNNGFSWIRISRQEAKAYFAK